MKRVRLISVSERPIETVAFAAQICYGNKKGDIDSPEFKAFVDSGDAEKLIKNCIKRGHLSVIEHAYFTLRFDNVSRILSHQEVRHRLQAISQRSQRYCDEDGFAYIIPPAIQQNSELEKKLKELAEHSQQVYSAFVAAGIKREDARYSLLENTCTSMIVSMNARELRHIIQIRCEKHAQWEIRELFKEVVREIGDKRPECKIFFEDIDIDE